MLKSLSNKAVVSFASSKAIVTTYQKVRTLSVKNIGFIGIGQMGAHMVKNMYLNSSFNISVLDTNKDRFVHLTDLIKSHKNTNLSNERLKNVSALKDLKDCNVIITMLPNSDVIERICFEEKLSTILNKGSYLIDCSTIAPEKAKSISNRLLEHGINGVDAPVSGGVIGADLGTLSFMVGAKDKKMFNNVEKIVLKMGSKAYNCQGIGKGQVAKLCNNMLLGITMIGLSESLLIAKNLDFDIKLLSEIINNSTGKCWSNERNCPVPNILNLNIPSNNNYAGGFDIKLIEKDLNLANELAKDANTPLFMGSAALQIYRKLSNMKEYKGLDFGAVFKWLSGSK